MPRGHHLEWTVGLSDESELKNLYPWFLFETKEDGTKVKTRDQIPWSWGLHFRISEIVLFSTLDMDAWSSDDRREKPLHHDREFIRATLKPTERDWYAPRFSMFGTARETNKFELYIYGIDQEEDEKCTAWGTVSSTSEIDFRDETSEDMVLFNLHVTAARFARFVQMITSQTLTSGSFRISGAEGFYSDWSPSVSTSHVKILTGEKAQSVEIPEGCSIEPPRLGKVEDFNLTFKTETKFPDAKVDFADDSEPEKTEDDAEPEPQVQFVADPVAVALLRSVRLAAWVIAGALLIIVLKLVL